MKFPQLQELVDWALQDKKLTRTEMDEIVTAIRADGKVSPEEVQLLDSIRQMILRREIQVVETAD
ncbi:MAG: hypothetical protein ACUVRV_05415 [Cyanobacteriota bacterium]